MEAARESSSLGNRHFQIPDDFPDSHGNDSKSEENRCLPCGKLFKDRNKLKAHNDYVHTYDIQICEVCSKEFKNRITLRHHVRIHTIKTINCKECNKEFKNDYRLECHMKCFHERSLDCICYVCGNKYKNDYALKRHMKKVCLGKKLATKRNYEKRAKDGEQDGSEGRYCKECDKTFETEKALKRHRTLNHEWGAQKCPLCPLSAQSIGSLRRHCRLVHKVTKDESKLLLPTHQRKERIFKGKRVVCNLCGKSYDDSKKKRHNLRCPGLAANIKGRNEEMGKEASTSDSQFLKDILARADTNPEQRSESKSKQDRKREEKVNLWKSFQKTKEVPSSNKTKGEIFDKKKSVDQKPSARVFPPSLHSSSINSTEIPAETFEKKNSSVESHPDDILKTDKTKEELAEQLGLTFDVYQNLTRDQLLETLHEAILSEPNKQTKSSFATI